jgi:2,4-dienoyl-CoA reductase-like NADH-dependent reductase (Old Yellow Enzyme family)/NADH dehydrogenase FAD-containing subunit
MTDTVNHCKYVHLFEPLTLGNRLFRNRIFAAPTGFRISTYDSVLPTEAYYYYGRKAMGGAASVSTGELIIDKEIGCGGPFHICIDDPRSLMPLGKIAAEISRYGAVPTAELQHAGMYANRDLAILGGAATGEAYGPVDCELDGRLIRKMPEEMIEKTVVKYAEAALAAKARGFGMILIHAGHGWLLHQFLSKQLNTRGDRWGGRDIENRSRFAIAVCDAVRKALGPGFPIEIRISGAEGYKGGYDIDEGVAFAKLLDGHADLIHVSVGSHEVREAFTLTHPRMFLGDGCNVKYAAEVKKHVRTPVATVGAIGEPEMMEEIIASGKADVVELARSLIADPDLPSKIRAGKEDAIKPCMRCLFCFSSQINLGIKHCAVNPESGFEYDSKYSFGRNSDRKKILVAGGGIGGMEAAITCAKHGHEVILCEKNDMPGGAIRCERNVPFKRKLEMYIRTQEYAIRRLGIDLRLNTEVTPAYAEKSKADVIIAATGSVSMKPAIAGIESFGTIDAETAYRRPEECGDVVFILGAGLVGLELALYLSMLGHKVEVAEMTAGINDGGNMLHAQGLMIELDNRNINVRFKTAATEITANGIWCETENAREFFPADTIVYATGRRPRQAEALALKFSAPEFFMIGDCVRVGNIAEATGTAHATATNIGIYRNQN